MWEIYYDIVRDLNDRLWFPRDGQSKSLIKSQRLQRRGAAHPHMAPQSHVLGWQGALPFGCPKGRLRPRSFSEPVAKIYPCRSHQSCLATHCRLWYDGQIVGTALGASHSGCCMQDTGRRDPPPSRSPLPPSNEGTE